MLPEKLQSRLVNSEDDFIEASMDGTDYDEIVLAIMAKLNAIVGRYRAIPSRQTMSRLRGYSTCRVKEDQPTSGRSTTRELMGGFASAEQLVRHQLREASRPLAA